MYDTKLKVVMNWSGGKDSALALYRLLQSELYEVVALITGIDKENRSSSVHGLPMSLLQQQAESIGIPLYTFEFNRDLTNYQSAIAEITGYFKDRRINTFAFGDLQSSNIKPAREKLLNPLGINVLEPLWVKCNEEVMNDFLHSEISATIIVADATIFPQTIIGKDLNRQTINSFPKGIDLCGESGEYHTLTYKGAIYQRAVKFRIDNSYLNKYNIRLNSGEIKSYAYWQAKIIPH